MELAVVYRTADGAGIEHLAALADRAVAEQVSGALARRDMAMLSELRRAAEDTEWPELHKKAGSALEEVALPRVLEVARSRGDVFGQLAVEHRARSKGLHSLASQASDIIVSASDALAPSPDVPCEDSEEIQTSYNKEQHPVLVEQMQMLLDETYTGWGGFGKRTRTRDRPNERVAERLEVERVVQLRNMESYLNYLVRREVVAAELPEGVKRDWNVRTNSGDLSPQAAVGSSIPGFLANDCEDGSCRSLLSAVDPDLNENYLWHGTGPAEAQGISERGFDIEQAGSSRGALFGRGLYFAESCLKADEYVRPDDKGRYPLILCRVTLGNINYCDAEDPCRETLRVSCRTGGGGHHSVLGDREKVRQTFREFVIFDGHQAYPEFVVWYSRR